MRDDSHHIGASPDLVVKPLQHVGRFHVLPARQRQAEEVGQHLLDVLLDLASEVGILAAPFAKLGGEITPHL
jgi:hypothetical protein